MTIKSFDGDEIGRVDSQSSFSPQTVRALHRPRTASKTK